MKPLFLLSIVIVPFLLVRIASARPLTMTETRIAFGDPVELLEGPRIKAAFKKIMPKEDFELLYSIRGPQGDAQVEAFDGDEVFHVDMGMAHFAVMQLDLGFSPPNKFWVWIHGPWGEHVGEISHYYSTAPKWQKKMPEGWGLEESDGETPNESKNKLHPVAAKRLAELAPEFVVDDTAVKPRERYCALDRAAFGEIHSAKVKAGVQRAIFKTCSKPCTMVEEGAYVVGGDTVYLFGKPADGRRCGAFIGGKSKITSGWLDLSQLEISKKPMSVGPPEPGEWTSIFDDADLKIEAGKSGPRSRVFAFTKTVGAGPGMGPEFDSKKGFVFDGRGEGAYVEGIGKTKVRVLSRPPFLAVVPDLSYATWYLRRPKAAPSANPSASPSASPAP